MKFTLTDAVINYTWRQLARRAGVSGSDPAGHGFENLDISIHYARPDLVSPERPGIVVVPCGEDAMHALVERPDRSLTWLPGERLLPPGEQLPFNDPIPIPLWGEGCENKGEPWAWSDRLLVLYVDLVAIVFFMLSRWEETILPDRDKHGRFPATASVAYKQGFLDHPIVDEYALILREWLKVLLPRWKPRSASFSVKLSHDIDNTRRFNNVPTAAKSLGRDLLKYRDPKRALDTLRDTMAQVIASARTSDIQGIYHLADLSLAHGLDNDAFYFMADGPGPFGCGYDPTSPVVRKCINDLLKQGFEVGFHPGYHTFQNPDRLAKEKARMDTILGETSYGGRQHFLRFQAPDTWCHWEQVGLAYDSTLTYADHEGFRCGTCHPFRPFDIEQNREMDIWEIPLIVMDGTLRNYQGLTPEQGETRILELARRCKKVSGVFTLLWHNSSLRGAWQPWGEMYERVVRMLGRMQKSHGKDE